MSRDCLSPTTLARIKVLVLPAGRIKRTRYHEFVGRLARYRDISLAKVPPAARSSSDPFSPLNFPEGHVFYDFLTSIPAQTQSELFPFELFRHPLVIIGVADAAEYARDPDSGLSAPSYEPLVEFAENLPRRYNEAAAHRIILFDSTCAEDSPTSDLFIHVAKDDGEQSQNTLEAGILRLTTTMLFGMNSFLSKWQSGNDFADIFPNYFGIAQKHSGLSAEGMPKGAPANYRLATKEIWHPVGTFFESPKPNLQSQQSDRPKSIASFPTTLFRSKTASSLSPSKGSAPPQGNFDKNRVSLLVGCLYLCAGNWSSALKELIDGSTRAKQQGDLLWYAKGLENSLVCLLLLLWTGASFDIPHILIESIAGQTSANLDESNIQIKIGTSDESWKRAASALSAVIPGVIRTIINIYSENHFQGRYTSLGFSESSIRLCKLASVLYVSGGVLNKQSVNFTVLGEPEMKVRNQPFQHSLKPNRHDITYVLFNSIPQGLSPVDYVSVLGEISSVLDILGLERKRGLVLREIVSFLSPYFIQARKIGAAELGLHPAVSLAKNARLASRISPDGFTKEDQSISGFLWWVCQTYGVLGLESSPLSLYQPTNAPIEAASTQIRHTTSLGQFSVDFVMSSLGNFALKRDILQDCIRVCEALPDFQAALDFTSLLMRTLNPRFAILADSTFVGHRNIHEQHSLLWRSHLRLVEMAYSSGFSNTETDYWDPFLVRKVRLLEGPDHLALTKMERSDYLRHPELQPRIRMRMPWTRISEVSENILVEGESHPFLVTIQNPYHTDIELESMTLSTTGPEVEAIPVHGILKASSFEDWKVTIVPKEAGSLQVHGCKVKVRGCREFIFPIFSQKWVPRVEQKIKDQGIAAINNGRLVESGARTEFGPDGGGNTPVAAVLNYRVAGKLPALAMTKISCPQSSIMLLEDQAQKVSITLKNLSSTCANSILVGYSHPIQENILNRLTTPDLPIHEAVELERELTMKPVMKISSDCPGIERLGPEEEHIFEFVITGKAGLDSVTVTFSYSTILDKPGETEAEFVLMRHVRVPISVTINPGVDLRAIDMYSLKANPWVRADQTQFYFPSVPGFTPGPAFRRHVDKTKEHCVMFFDLYNNWTSPVSVQLDLLEQRDKPLKELSLKYQSEDGEARPVYSIVSVIEPGSLVRVPFVVPRFYLAHQYDRIDHLIPEYKKQFTISQIALTSDGERRVRRAFWYRNELFQLINSSWTINGIVSTESLQGELSMWNIGLSPSMVEALSLDGVEISMRIDDIVTDSASATEPKQPLTLKLDKSNVLRVSVHNRSLKPVCGILRIQPRLHGLDPPTAAYDLHKRMAFSGILEQEVPDVGPGERADVLFSFVVLTPGEFEVSACFDKIFLPDKCGSGGGQGQGDEAARGATSLDIAEFLAVGDRATQCWTMNTAFRIRVFDDDDDENE